MTDIVDTGYEHLLDTFGRQLDAAAVQARSARRRHRAMVAGGLALASIAVAALLPIGGGGGAKLELVAQAKAALAPAGQIVHLVTTTHLETRGGERPGVGPATFSQQWSTSSPPRWRVATSVPTPVTTPGGKPVGDLDGLITGPMQFSFAGGTSEVYYQQPNRIEITSGFGEGGSHAAPSGPLGVDPVIQIRAMLDADQLHDAGSTHVHGRMLRRLVGRVPRGSHPAWLVEYDVDPITFAPVRVTIEAGKANHPGAGIPTIVLDVGTYERIPLDATTEKLLKITPIGKPKYKRYG